MTKLMTFLTVDRVSNHIHVNGWNQVSKRNNFDFILIFSGVTTQSGWGCQFYCDHVIGHYKNCLSDLAFRGTITDKVDIYIYNKIWMITNNNFQLLPIPQFAPISTVLGRTCRVSFRKLQTAPLITEIMLSLNQYWISEDSMMISASKRCWILFVSNSQGDAADCSVAFMCFAHTCIRDKTLSITVRLSACYHYRDSKLSSYSQD